MTEMGPITLAMLKQHQIVNKFLEDSEKISEDDIYQFVKLFNLFKWNLNKHLFIEEENIFPVVDSTNKKELNQIQGLLNDHKDIRKIIDNFDEEIGDGIRPNTSILRELLFKHEGREIDDFYPILDKRLTSDKRKEILEKIKEIRLG